MAAGNRARIESPHPAIAHATEMLLLLAACLLLRSPAAIAGGCALLARRAPLLAGC